MLLGFPRHALLLIVVEAIVWNLNLKFGLPRSTISNCERAKKATRASLGTNPRGNCDVFLILESDLLLCSCLRSLVKFGGKLDGFLWVLFPFVSDRTENDTT